MRSGICALLLAAAALAGGGPETTLVVVNADSGASRRVAEEYVALRDIPESNVLFLRGVPAGGVLGIDAFLKQVWGPVGAYLDARPERRGAIRLVTYSVDFPYAVDFKARKEDRFAHASLNGLTYLIRHVQAGDPFWELDVNPYYRLLLPRQMTSAERSLWNEAGGLIQAKKYAEAAALYEKILKGFENGVVRYNLACCLARLGKREAALDELERAAKAGFRNPQQAAGDPDLASLKGSARFQPILRQMTGKLAVGVKPGVAFGEEGYYLSTHLGYTGRFGNSVPEVLAYLKRTAAADGTKPEGTVYFCRNGDIRSKTREPFVDALRTELEKRGRKFAVLEGVLPDGRKDVIGAILGKASFSWAKSKAEMLPGAIVEHLTSHGGNFGTPGQTKFSEILRYGAAGSSGTVHEPYALHPKFPNPLLHVFYADGCSLAEAFYASLWGPYQLMIAGDGLARPFATFVPVKVDAPAGPWKGEVALAVDVGAEGTKGKGKVEVWTEGRPISKGEAGGRLVVDTRGLDDGPHDVRVVHVAADPVATRSYARLDVVVANTGRSLAQHTRGAAVEVKAAGARRFQLLAGGQEVAASTDGRLAFPFPGTFTPRAVFADGAAVRGEPVRYAPPLANLPAVEPPQPLKPGLRGTLDGRPVVVANIGDRHAGRRLRDLGNATQLALEGWFRVPRKGIYQLLVRGDAEVDLGGADPAWFAAEEGWHPIRIGWQGKGKGKGKARPEIEILLGGAQVLAPPDVRHFSFPALKERDRPTVDAGAAAVVDGKRDGKGVPVPKEGLILSFKRPVRDIAAVTLFPPKGGKGFPLEWSVEVRGSTGKWRSVKELQQISALPPKVGKDKPEIPLFVELSFKPERAKRLRISVKGDASLVEVEVLGRLKKSR